jgi:hypothetical protein
VSSTLVQKNGGISQVIVSGLTQLFAGFDSVNMNVDSVNKRQYLKQYLTKDDVYEGLTNDYVNGYLFSGSIDTEIYAESCLFTDPTLSFRGLTRFENNIKAIKPLIKTFIDDSLVVLYDLKYDNNDEKTSTSIKGRWRMSGGLKLPWSPRIELTGQTRYTIDPSDNRIVDYYETWNLPASTALMQLLQPSTRKGKILLDNQNIKAVDLSRTKSSLLSLIKYRKTSKTEEKIRDTVDRLRLVRKVGDLPDDLLSISDFNNRMDNKNIVTHLNGTTWEVLYCSKTQFNPYNAKIKQKFLELQNNESKIELCITESEFFPGLSFKLIAKIEPDKNDIEKIKVTYQQKAISLTLFGNDINLRIENIKDKNQGYWKKIFEDQTIRIFENDNNNIFILRII